MSRACDRKIIYIPKLITDDEDETEDEDDGMWQRLIEDFSETVTDEESKSGEFPEKSPFDSLIAEMRAKEEAKKDDDDEDEFDPSKMYVAFETNHPLATPSPVAARTSNQSVSNSRPPREWCGSTAPDGISRVGSRSVDTSCRAQQVHITSCGSLGSFSPLLSTTRGGWSISL